MGLWLCCVVAPIVLRREALNLLYGSDVAVLRLGGVAAVQSAIRVVRPWLLLRHPAATVVLYIDIGRTVERVRPQRTTARILVGHALMLDQRESVEGKRLVVIEDLLSRLGRS